jgi:hypothetical protein
MSVITQKISPIARIKIGILVISIMNTFKVTSRNTMTSIQIHKFCILLSMSIIIYPAGNLQIERREIGLT